MSRPAAGRNRATMVEARRTVIDRLRRRGVWPSRNPWMPALAASRERVVGSAVLGVRGNLL